jgi:Na+/H+ antiporter NhaD/arsenite permease-like protein
VEPGSVHVPLGAVLPLWTVLPFGLLLGAIAILPMAAPRWWDANGHKGIVALLVAAPLAAYLLFAHGAEGGLALGESLQDYLSFIALLGSLFVISGGIHVGGSLAGTPIANTAFLGTGAVLANMIGTTGASMILVRPLLRANAERRRTAHVFVFFIFVVSNCGGLLTPLGDPPLFLGFLKGVPFLWPLSLWKQWLMVNGLLLVAFHIIDEVLLEREERERPEGLLDVVLEHRPIRVTGLHNLVFLGGVVAVMVARGAGWGTGGEPWPFGIQEGAMALLAATAYVTTGAQLRIANRFRFGPILEVAVLFLGIFVTMTAPLLILNARGAALGLETSWHYFWATGALSSFLDNAPTYLTFAATAAGAVGVSVESGSYLADVVESGRGAALLAAISCGAVMMGANTYIGNGPNFMVRAIVEENGVRMPSFFGYMAWSAAVLLPIFLLVTLIFFR